VLLALGTYGIAYAQSLNNDGVIKLVKSGLLPEIIIAKIDSEKVEFNLASDQLIALQSQGVPASVIAAMIKKGNARPALSSDSPDPLAPHYSGVYSYSNTNGQSAMVRIDPTSSSQVKTGGILGYALTGGIASASLKVTFPGETTRYKIAPGRPTFYMYFGPQFDGGNVSGGAFVGGANAAAQSPNELNLVQLTKKKGRREARVGSFNVAGSKAGILDKDQIAFDYSEVSPGIFKVEPQNSLVAGEYGFVYAVSGGGVGIGAAGAGSARVFAFTIE
jgi:hypothetical protein